MYTVHEDKRKLNRLVGRTFKSLVDSSLGCKNMVQVVAFFQPGHAPGHIHDPEEECIYVISGQGEIWIEGVPYGIAPRTAIYTPSGVEHSVNNTGKQDMKLIGVFSPPVVPGSYANLPPRTAPTRKALNPQVSYVLCEDDVEVKRLMGRTCKVLMKARNMTQIVSFHPPRSETLLRGCELSEEVAYVLAGYGEIIIDGFAEQIRPGTAIYVPPATECLLRNKSAGEIKLLEVFSPPVRLPELGKERASGG